MILIVASNKDVASKNIAKKIIEVYEFEKASENFMENPQYHKKINNKEVRIVTIEDELIFSQHITDFFKPETAIFVSRHESRNRIPILSVHTPGNLGVAEFGGMSRKVSISPANSMRRALIEMTEQREALKLDEFTVSYECTHHGPSLDIPTMFVEVGSSLTEWRNLRAAEAVAHAAIAAIVKESIVPAVFGIGGAHLNKAFTEISLKHEVAFGHIIPKYALRNIDSTILKHCVKRTLEKVQKAILDWDGISGGDRERLTSALREDHIEVKKSKDLKNSSPHPR